MERWFLFNPVILGSIRKVNFSDLAQEIIIPPAIGGFVGADALIASYMCEKKRGHENVLMIDVGTNTEIVLLTDEGAYATSAASGPAFEGGDISCGMRATNGAVDACTIDDETFEPTLSVIGGGKPLGLCGSGIISIIAELFESGIISPKGKFAVEHQRIVHDEYGGTEYVFATAEESATGKPLSINETDIDNFIRAKGAIFSAIRTMLKSVDMTVEDIDRIIIAGGIGSGIDIAKAVKIGMLPKQPLEKYSYIGNSSLTGACAMLISDDALAKVSDIANNMTYIELSTHPGYMDEFVASCFIPHTDASLF